MIAAGDKASDDQRNVSERFEQTGQVLHAAADAQPAPLQHSEANHDSERHRRINISERRKEHAGILRDNERDEGAAAAGRNPIAPTDDEANVIAERVAREDVLAA